MEKFNLNHHPIFPLLMSFIPEGNERSIWNSTKYIMEFLIDEIFPQLFKQKILNFSFSMPHFS